MLVLRLGRLQSSSGMVSHAWRRCRKMHSGGAAKCTAAMPQDAQLMRNASGIGWAARVARGNRSGIALIRGSAARIHYTQWPIAYVLQLVETM